MRFLLTLSFALSALIFIGCGEDEAKNAAREKVESQTPANPNTPATTPTTANAGGAEHYICPNGHVGSGGAAEGTCSQCGTALVHNQAFHDNQNNSQVTANPANQQFEQGQQAQQPVQAQPEPAQNAAGVWHYTCASGCAGGAGSPGACAQCGGQLAHNAAYHNQ